MLLPTAMGSNLGSLLPSVDLRPVDGRSRLVQRSGERCGAGWSTMTCRSSGHRRVRGGTEPAYTAGSLRGVNEDTHDDLGPVGGTQLTTSQHPLTVSPDHLPAVLGSIGLNNFFVNLFVAWSHTTHTSRCPIHQSEAR